VAIYARRRNVTKIGQEFMERTKFQHLEPSDQMKRLPQPPLEVPAIPGKPRVVLPAPGTIQTGGLDMREAIERRRSIRRYAETALDRNSLSFLLWCTQGVQQVMQGRATLRTVPSAGARHALETYLLINNVEGIEPGLYRYLALEHSLISVATEPGIAAKITRACLNQAFIQESAVTFLWSADAYRMTWRYGERGYRYLHLDAGHACQNLFLASEAVGCGVCPIGAFDDDTVNEVLGIDGKNQFVIYIATVGKKG
jgi:SagB-type dehydrogenase family enzyme